MSACTHYNNSSEVIQSRDNEIDISFMIEEFDMGEIIIGKQALLATTPENLYVFDIGSSDNLVYIFDPFSGSYKGQGINYGPGPNEIGQPDIPTVSTYMGRDKILMIDLAQWKIMRYDTDSMIVDSAYVPQRLLKINENNFPSRARVINDSTLLAQNIWLDPNSSKFTKVLERFNLRKGAFESFIDPSNGPAQNFSYDARIDKNLIVSGDYGKDRILLLDSSGLTKRNILGPEYGSDKKLIAFSNIVITDKYILAVYSGCKIEPSVMAYDLDMLGKKIVVMDHEGNYLATLKTDSSIKDIKYHEETGKLYLALSGDIQIGRVDLEKILSDEISINNTPKSINNSPNHKEASSNPDKTPIVFLDDKDQETDHLDLGNILISNANDAVSYQMIQCDKNSKNEKFDIDSVIVTPDFIDGDLGLNFMYPGLLTSLTLRLNGKATAGPFRGKVEIYGNGFDKPATCSISGTIVKE